MPTQYDHVVRLIEENAGYINWLAETQGNVEALDLLDLCREARAGERALDELRRRVAASRLVLQEEKHRLLVVERKLKILQNRLLDAFRLWASGH